MLLRLAVALRALQRPWRQGVDIMQIVSAMRWRLPMMLDGDATAILGNDGIVLASSLRSLLPIAWRWISLKDLVLEALAGGDRWHRQHHPARLYLP